MRRVESGLTDEGLRDVFVSPNVADSNLEPANVVDVIDKLAHRVKQVANAITPPDAAPGRDNHASVVCSLTEAVMSLASSVDGVAEGLHAIAEAIRDRTT
jgi:hypothetical protein